MTTIHFGQFRLDLAEERLWKATQELAIRRKPFAILRYLATNPRRLVTHDELLAQVWNGLVVSDSAVRTHLHELRQLLGDDVIETVIGRGYRFVAELDVNASAAENPVVTRAPSSHLHERRAARSSCAMRRFGRTAVRCPRTARADTATKLAA
jgi:DNA-binding winged helix-turn-helix (wHTH) protein